MPIIEVEDASGVIRRKFVVRTTAERRRDKRVRAALRKWKIGIDPDLYARVSLFDKNNQKIIHLGDDEAWTAQVKDTKRGIRNDPKKWRPGRFVHPHDACFDAVGNIFVVEWVEAGRVTLLKKIV